MAAGFDLDPEALTAGSVDVDRAHTSLVAALGDVRAELTALVGSGWRGQAASTFLAGYEEWERGAGRVVAALADLGGALDDSRRAYLGTDAGVADRQGPLAARLHSRLGGIA
ncbi:WXG100 family type VII secretion target [Jatrophihabitans sp. YIM 134969]